MCCQRGGLCQGIVANHCVCCFLPSLQILATRGLLSMALELGPNSQGAVLPLQLGLPMTVDGCSYARLWSASGPCSATAPKGTAFSCGTGQGLHLHSWVVRGCKQRWSASTPRKR